MKIHNLCMDSHIWFIYLHVSDAAHVQGLGDHSDLHTSRIFKIKIMMVSPLRYIIRADALQDIYLQINECFLFKRNCFDASLQRLLSLLPALYSDKTNNKSNDEWYF